jgi:hypothetical protein
MLDAFCSVVTTPLICGRQASVIKAIFKRNILEQLGNGLSAQQMVEIHQDGISFR